MTKLNASRTKQDGAVLLRETVLPGVGRRFDLTGRHGPRVAVVQHWRGQCNLILYDDPADPDAGRQLISLTRQEAAALAGLLTGPVR